MPIKLKNELDIRKLFQSKRRLNTALEGLLTPLQKIKDKEAMLNEILAIKLRWDSDRQSLISRVTSTCPVAGSCDAQLVSSNQI